MTDLERFLAVMEYKPVDRGVNHELGVWPQSIERWKTEDMPPDTLHFNWFVGEEYFGMDRREYIRADYGMIPPFEQLVLEETDRYQIIQDSAGMIRKALTEGQVGSGRMCMDQFLRFPVETLEDFRKLKKRYETHLPARTPANLDELISTWKNRSHVLVLGENCAAGGFYWRAREWMGTENVSLGWYDNPELMHEMMEFYADFVIEVSKPILEKIDVEYFNLSEDLAMKTGPLLSPATFKEFIFPHMKRLIEFMKSHGVRYVSLDSDGNCEVLIPLFMDAGVDMMWPFERASDMDPVRIRKQIGKSLRMFGGVDKRELAKGPTAIEAHLKELAPLVEEGGFIPTVDHTVPPDVSWDNICYYFDAKRRLLEGKL